MSELVERRLRNQLLIESRLRAPEDVVSWMGAMQAQDYSGAKWAVGLRATGVTDADVEGAFDRGAILRTHFLRPTWHFVAPADIRWMLRLSAPRRWRRKLKPGAVVVGVQPFRPLTRTEDRAVAAETARHGRFMNVSATLSYV